MSDTLKVSDTCDFLADERQIFSIHFKVGKHTGMVIAELPHHHLCGIFHEEILHVCLQMIACYSPDKVHMIIHPANGGAKRHTAMRLPATGKVKADSNYSFTFIRL